MSNEDIDDMMVSLIHHKEHQGIEYKQNFFSDLKIIIDSEDHLKCLLGVLGLWIYSAFNYYLIGYYVKYFPGDVFYNFMMMTVAEVISPIYLRLVQGRYPSKNVT